MKHDFILIIKYLFAEIIDSCMESIIYLNQLHPKLSEHLSDTPIFFSV